LQCSLSPEGEASIDSGLIHDQEVCIEEPPSGGFSSWPHQWATSEISTKRTSSNVRCLVANGGKADIVERRVTSKKWAQE
jgi:hypothetical protein